MCIITWTKLCTQVLSHGAWKCTYPTSLEYNKTLGNLFNSHPPSLCPFPFIHDKSSWSFSTWNLCDDHDSGNKSGTAKFSSLSAQAYTFYEPKKERQQCRERNPGSTLLHCQCNWETVISIIMSEGIKNKTKKEKHPELQPTKLGV